MRFTIEREQLLKWGKNTLIFFAPALIIFLTIIQNGGTTEEALVALKVWVINVAIDFLRKTVALK